MFMGIDIILVAIVMQVDLKDKNKKVETKWCFTKFFTKKLSADWYCIKSF